LIDTFKIRQVEEEYVVINFVGYLSSQDEEGLEDFGRY
jgi:mRNA interferase MazF